MAKKQIAKYQAFIILFYKKTNHKKKHLGTFKNSHAYLKIN